MKRRQFLVASGLGFTGMIFEKSTPAVPQDKTKTPSILTNTEDSHTPVTGEMAPGVALLDEIMLKYLKKIGCSTATLAVSFKGKLLYSRGYGWVDEARSSPASPDTMIGIASCDKPIIAASIRQLARNKQLSLNDSPFKLLKIKPHGRIIDAHVRDIKISHLLEHKAGWQGEAFNKAVKAARAEGYRDPISIKALLSFIMVQKMQDAPGTKFKYDNFGYDTLRQVISAVSGGTAVEYFRNKLFQPFGVKEQKGFRNLIHLTRKGIHF